jgi:hypothetical protein
MNLVIIKPGFRVKTSLPTQKDDPVFKPYIQIHKIYNYFLLLIHYSPIQFTCRLAVNQIGSPYINDLIELKTKFIAIDKFQLYNHFYSTTVFQVNVPCLTN